MTCDRSMNPSHTFLAFQFLDSKYSQIAVFFLESRLIIFVLINNVGSFFGKNNVQHFSQFAATTFRWATKKKKKKSATFGCPSSFHVCKMPCETSKSVLDSGFVDHRVSLSTLARTHRGKFIHLYINNYRRIRFDRFASSQSCCVEINIKINDETSEKPDIGWEIKGKGQRCLSFWRAINSPPFLLWGDVRYQYERRGMRKRKERGGRKQGLFQE